MRKALLTLALAGVAALCATAQTSNENPNAASKTASTQTASTQPASTQTASGQTASGQTASAQPVSAAVASTADAPAQPAPAADPAVVVKPVSNKIVPTSKVYIQPMDGFENYLVAALQKKKVQLLPVAEKDQADYVITGTSVDKKAGWAKIVFQGNVHSDNAASITLTDKKSGVILYAYSVDKKSTMHGQQTTAEACAK